MSLRGRWQLHGKEMLAEFDGNPDELGSVLLSMYVSHARDSEWPVYVLPEYVQLFSDNGIIMRGAERTNGVNYYLTAWGVFFIEDMFAYGLKCFLNESESQSAM